MKRPALFALHEVEMFRQGELHFGAQERPDPVGWDVIPVRQKFFEHPWFYWGKP